MSKLDNTIYLSVILKCKKCLVIPAKWCNLNISNILNYGVKATRLVKVFYSEDFSRNYEFTDQDHIDQVFNQNSDAVYQANIRKFFGKLTFSTSHIYTSDNYNC